jgi:hypothetical protein
MNWPTPEWNNFVLRGWDLTCWNQSDIIPLTSATLSLFLSRSQPVDGSSSSLLYHLSPNPSKYLSVHQYCWRLLQTRDVLPGAPWLNWSRLMLYGAGSRGLLVLEGAPYWFHITALRALSRIGFVDPKKGRGGGIIITPQREENSMLWNAVQGLWHVFGTT